MGRARKYHTEEERKAAQRLHYENWKLKKDLQAMKDGGEDYKEYSRRKRREFRERNGETMKPKSENQIDKISELEEKINRLTKLLEEKIGLE